MVRFTKNTVLSQLFLNTLLQCVCNMGGLHGSTIPNGMSGQNSAFHGWECSVLWKTNKSNHGRGRRHYAVVALVGGDAVTSTHRGPESFSGISTTHKIPHPPLDS